MPYGSAGSGREKYLLVVTINILRYCIVTNFISCGRPCSSLIHYNIIIIISYIIYRDARRQWSNESTTTTHV